MKHPQTNGLVERENRSLGEGIKARLDKGSKNKLEDVPHVLWEHRTMINSINVFTLFSLTYEIRAKIPVENGMPSLRCMEVDQVRNNESLLLNLDMLQEKRERYAVRETKRKSKMEKYYNAKVRNTLFKSGGFVYKSNDASHVEDTGKLDPKWEGPYEAVEVLGKGTYKLRNGS
ncbi:reverse transcriptase domain-containing protein [Tanacetum coccineum]